MGEVFVRIGGNQYYLWRAVDQDGEVVDVLLQRKRDDHVASTDKRHRFPPQIISYAAWLYFRVLSD